MSVAVLEGIITEGTGNTFLLLDLRGPHASGFASPQLDRIRSEASRLCQAERVDGVLAVTQARGADVPRMTVFNRDGSRPEMCGNGLRCVVAHLGRTTGARELTVRSDAGEHRGWVDRIAGAEAVVRIEVGRARQLTPVTPACAGGRTLHPVDVGNPHAIHFAAPSDDVERLADELGPAVELAPEFAPHRTNVEFARIAGDGTVRLAVWERGVGRTDACGTGAAATAVAAVHRGLVQGPEVAVELRGGALRVVVPTDPGDAVLLQGSTREVRRVELRWPPAKRS